MGNRSETEKETRNAVTFGRRQIEAIVTFAHKYRNMFSFLVILAVAITYELYFDLVRRSEAESLSPQPFQQ